VDKQSTRRQIGDNLYIVWTLAFKDILDAVKNKVVISLVLTLGLMVLLPKSLPLIFAQPHMAFAILDLGTSQLTTAFEESPEFEARIFHSFEDMQAILTGSPNVELGVVIPAEFDQSLTAGDELVLDGYVSWENRRKASQLEADFESQAASLLGVPVDLRMDGHLLYPLAETNLSMGMLAVTTVTMILMIGVTLVPTLIFEEKQTQTIDALLVSPASSAHVVAGKALAGMFYTVLGIVFVFAVNWTGVVQWPIAVLFMIGTGSLATAMGLFLGTFFERQQDAVGISTAFTLIFVGAVILDLLKPPLPGAVSALVPWVPSIALVRIFDAVFLENSPTASIWGNMGGLLACSLAIYALVVWKLRRTER
jgi:ABC-type multidrug transport system permease subunit